MNQGDVPSPITRRDFLQTVALASGAMLIDGHAGAETDRTPLKVTARLGSVKEVAGDTPIPGACWLTAEAPGDGLTYVSAPGFLAKSKYITADLLTEGTDMTVFGVVLQEGEQGRKFRYHFGTLPECSVRLRMSLELVDQHRWVNEREGGLLKPSCWGDPVDLARVDRVNLLIVSKHPEPTRWCMTPLSITSSDVELLSKPALPKGKLIDEFGQSRLRSWPAKVPDLAELKRRIHSQSSQLPQERWPETFSRWGGCKSKKLTEGAGFFRTHHDGKRWWLVDPDGYAFWSTGLDCVDVEQCAAAYGGLASALSWTPDPAGEFQEIYRKGVDIEDAGAAHINYLIANLIRGLGADRWHEKWGGMALGQLRQIRFNTVGNWSEWQFARTARFPYVRPMEFEAKRSGYIYRELPDVFHPGFERDTADFAGALTETADDPAFIGYFLMNEPTWGGFSSILPMAGMLLTTEECHTRREFARFLEKKYGGDAALSARWRMQATLSHVEKGKWQGMFSEESQPDLEEFSQLVVERFFNALSSACRKVDANHLNLGARYNQVPPRWAVAGMKSFDVFSMNRYKERVPHEAFEEIHGMLKKPVLVGEFGFGALDVGLPATGPAPRLRNQQDRGREYRLFVEDAAADPLCVGAHWFQMYDQSALGRPDGECYNLGLIDICNQLYPEMGHAIAATNERIYQVASGEVAAFNSAPEYLPLVSM